MPTPPPDAPLSPMVAETSLAYLHNHWALRRTLDPSQRAAPVTGWRSAAKGLLSRLAFTALRPYLDEEQELLANAVRLLDALARRCDALVVGQAAELDHLRADLIELSALLGGGAGGLGGGAGGAHEGGRAAPEDG